MASRDYARVVHLAMRDAPVVGLLSIDRAARFPITDGDGAERWFTWQHGGFDAYRERFWPKVPLHHFVSPPRPLPDGQRRQVEVHLRDPQGWLLRPVEYDSDSEEYYSDEEYD